MGKFRLLCKLRAEQSRLWAESHITHELAVQGLYNASRWGSVAPSASLQASLASNPQSSVLVLVLVHLAQWRCKSQRCACLDRLSHVRFSAGRPLLTSNVVIAVS